ncbi:MAG: DUF4189 domain-containing protein [Mycobacteriaceae bacterium]|nr:DUF4189 domain-containing protein [Mycobacteriaceae bacterium]
MPSFLWSSWHGYRGSLRRRRGPLTYSTGNRDDGGWSVHRDRLLPDHRIHRLGQQCLDDGGGHAHIALGNCQPHGSGCQVTSWAHNGCAALALGSCRWGGAWGSNAGAAQANALAMVTAGRIVELHCTG